jgi:hypothetical protein
LIGGERIVALGLNGDSCDVSKRPEANRLHA